MEINVQEGSSDA